MTEDEVVNCLCEYLQNQGWDIVDKKLNTEKGTDIIAQHEARLLLVEVKGSKGGAKHTSRAKFDSGQLKTHLGKALVKCIELKYDNPSAEVAIAHPNDPYIRGIIYKTIPFMIECGIKLIWVTDEKTVEFE